MMMSTLVLCHLITALALIGLAGLSEHVRWIQRTLGAVAMSFFAMAVIGSLIQLAKAIS